jgi:hypothetical protein
MYGSASKESREVVVCSKVTSIKCRACCTTYLDSRLAARIGRSLNANARLVDSQPRNLRPRCREASWERLFGAGHGVCPVV